MLLISFLAPPIHGVIAACVMNNVGAYPMQILDGVSVGLQGVAATALADAR